MCWKIFESEVLGLFFIIIIELLCIFYIEVK